MVLHSDIAEQLSGGIGELASVNGDLMPARSAICAALMGLPAGVLSATPTAPEDPNFIRRLETVDLGPFSVTGLKPAVHKLRAVITDISLEHPTIYDRLGCSEMLSCRLVRRSHSIVSAHTWGVALDLTIDGQTLTDGTDKVMDALIRIWPIFNRHGFYWGISFGLGDATHFEASDQLIRSWADAGLFTKNSPVVLPRAWNLGDRGPHILQLQTALNGMLAPVRILEDGMFGPQTRMAVLAFQRKSGLPPTGAVPKPVLAALGMI